MNTYFRQYISGFLLLFCISIISCNRNAQPASDSQSTLIANEEIRNLKTGTLVVRVPAQRNKQVQLQKLIDSGNGSGAIQKRAVNTLTETKQEVSSFVFYIDSLMQSSYKFSNYALIPDHNYDELLEGARSNIFMDGNAEIRSEFTLDTDFTVLLLDSYYAERNLIFVNSENKPIARPFPKLDRNIGHPSMFARFLRGFVGKSNDRDYKVAIKHINAILSRYYERVEE